MQDMLLSLIFCRSKKLSRSKYLCSQPLLLGTRSRLHDIKLSSNVPSNNNILEAITKINHRFDDLDHSLKQKIQSMDNKINVLTGTVHERSIRIEVSKLFGEDFAKPFTINGLQSLAHHLSKATGVRKKRDPSDIVTLSRKLAQSLLDNSVPENVLKHLAFCVSQKGDWSGIKETRARDVMIQFSSNFQKEFLNSSAPLSWEDVSVQQAVEAFKKSMYLLNNGTESEKSFSYRLALLLNLMKRVSTKSQKDELIKCDGCGLMLAIWESQKDFYVKNMLNNYKKCNVGKLLPTETVEMDVRGSVSVVGTFASIRCGEIKSSKSSINKATEQLLLRCELMGWALENVEFVNRSSITLIKEGHIFFPRSIESDADGEIASIQATSGLSIFLAVCNNIIFSFRGKLFFLKLRCCNFFKFCLLLL